MLTSRKAWFEDKRRYAILSSIGLGPMWYDIRTGCWASWDIRHGTLFRERGDARAVAARIAAERRRRPRRVHGRPLVRPPPIIVACVVLRTDGHGGPKLVRLITDGLRPDIAEAITTAIERVRRRRRHRSLPRMETPVERRHRLATGMR